MKAQQRPSSARRLWYETKADLKTIRLTLVLPVLVVVAILTGLSSVAAQQVSRDQFANAERAVSEKIWNHSTCGAKTAECRKQDRADSISFRDHERSVAIRTARLQTLPGAIFHGLAVSGTAIGLLAILVLVTQFIGFEWRRGTMAHVLAVGSRRVLLRRFAVVGILALGVALAAMGGATVAGALGKNSFPLPHAVNVMDWKLVIGAGIVLYAWAAFFLGVCWLERRPTHSLSIGFIAISLAALSTPLGRFSPGSLQLALLGLDKREQFEIGYVWKWPSLPQTGNPYPESFHVAVASNPVILAVEILIVAAMPLLLWRVGGRVQR